MSFKGRGKNWDTDVRIKRSEIVAKKINDLAGNLQNCSIMEYGCATGLISFNLYDKAKKLTLMDSEEEMINIVKEKVQNFNISNILPVKIDLTKENYLKEKFDLIYTSMTLHHIVDTENIINVFYNLLNEDGILCVIDLDKEDGSFHMNEKDFDGHNGFEHIEMEKTLKNAGFKNIISETFFYGKKIYQENIITYSMFYTIGKNNLI